MPKKNYPIIITKCIIIFFALSTIYGLVRLKSFIEWLIFHSDVTKIAILPQLTITMIIGGGIVIILLYLLFTLLDNIQKRIIFEVVNIKILRAIVVLCLLGGLVALVSSFYWIAWLPVAFVGCFLSLIIWVIQSIIAEAIVIKAENEFTI